MIRAPLLLLCILGVLPAFSESVTLLNGETHAGDLTIIDEYTLKISSASGILSFPLAALSEADLDRISLEKFGVPAAQRFSGEPRFWHERREALRSAIAAGADPGRLAALQAEIDSRRALIALYRDQLIEKERLQYARRQSAVTARRAELERLFAEDAAETRKRTLARVDHLKGSISRYKDQTVSLKNAQFSMHRGGPNWDAAQRRIDALDRQIAAALAEISALDPASAETN